MREGRRPGFRTSSIRATLVREVPQQERYAHADHMQIPIATLARGQCLAEDAFIETRRFGYELLNDPLLNKGTAFTDEERDAFELHGLLPPNVARSTSRSARRMQALRQLPSDLARYIFLRGLQDANETLFYAVLGGNLAEMLPVVYTPPSVWAARIQPDVPQAARPFPQLSATRPASSGFWPIRVSTDVDAIVVS